MEGPKPEQKPKDFGHDNNICTTADEMTTVSTITRPACLRNGVENSKL